MKKIFFTILILIISLSTYAQEGIAFNIVEQFLKSDIYYTSGAEKDEIRDIRIYCFDEKISVNYDRFSISKTSGKKISNMDFSKFGVKKEESNYVLFHSDLVDNQLMVEILGNKPEYLIPKKETEYRSYKSFNTGIIYLFLFSDEGCLVSVQKRMVVYD